MFSRIYAYTWIQPCDSTIHLIGEWYGTKPELPEVLRDVPYFELRELDYNPANIRRDRHFAWDQTC
jgi:hypothetical protein